MKGRKKERAREREREKERAEQAGKPARNRRARADEVEDSTVGVDAGGEDGGWNGRNGCRAIELSSCGGRDEQRQDGTGVSCWAGLDWVRAEMLCFHLELLGTVLFADLVRYWGGGQAGWV